MDVFLPYIPPLIFVELPLVFLTETETSSPAPEAAKPGENRTVFCNGATETHELFKPQAKWQLDMRASLDFIS